VSGGTLTLSGADTYTGVTTINGGTLALSGAGSIVDSSNVSINGTGNLKHCGGERQRDHRHPVGYCRHHGDARRQHADPEQRQRRLRGRHQRQRRADPDGGHRDAVGRRQPIRA